MKKAYVIGKNASKSLSPTIFNYWFKKHSIEGEYGFKEIDENSFNNTITTTLKEKNLCGLNITIPFKEKIIQHLDEIDEHTKLIGAANCVSKTNTRLTGSNTDWIGFKESIKWAEKNGKDKLEEKNTAVVIGYGGSAKAIVYSLSYMGFKNIRVFKTTHLYLV